MSYEQSIKAVTDALLRGRRSLLYNLQDFVNAVLEHGGEVRRGVLHQEVT